MHLHVDLTGMPGGVVVVALFFQVFSTTLSNSWVPILWEPHQVGGDEITTTCMRVKNRGDIGFETAPDNLREVTRRWIVLKFIHLDSPNERESNPCGGFPQG